jgi:hypothetical protein
MPDVDRRGFFRILRRADPAGPDSPAAEADEAAKDPRVRELSDLTVRLLADVEDEGAELLAEGTLVTTPYDLAYMRVTPDHIVFSVETGYSTIVPTKDVRAFDTEPPAASPGYGKLVVGVVRYHHPADPDHITRSCGFRFLEDSPLITTIRSACDLPEPEPEEPPDAAGTDPAPTAGETLT